MFRALPQTRRSPLSYPYTMPSDVDIAPQDVFRTELQAQGMLGVLEGGGENRARGGSGGDDNFSGDGASKPPSGGENLFLNMLRKLESIDVLGEGEEGGSASADNGMNGDGGGSGGNGGGGGGGDGGGGGGGGGLGSLSINGEDVDGGVLSSSPRAVGVGSSFAGVGAKLRSKFRKPSAFGIPSTPLGRGGGWGGGGGGDDVAVGDATVAAETGAGAGVDGGSKAFVEGASKALAMNRDRVMSWMKERRPKDLSPRQASRRGRRGWVAWNN